jgi:hypothetical protein
MTLLPPSAVRYGRAVRIVLVLVLAAALVVPLAQAKDRPIASYCSPSGDVCTGVFNRGGAVVLRVSTAANYFMRYRLCVRGPASRVCKVFPMRKTARGYDSQVRWAANFPNQGHGVYRVTWQYSAKALAFRR